MNRELLRSAWRAEKWMTLLRLPSWAFGFLVGSKRGHQKNLQLFWDSLGDVQRGIWTRRLLRGLTVTEADFINEKIQHLKKEKKC